MNFPQRFTNLNLGDCHWYAFLLNKAQTGTIKIHALNQIITSNPKNVAYILKTKFQNYLESYRSP